MSWAPFILSFKLAVVTSIILLLIALPLSHWLAYSQNRLKPIVETLITLPLVLPPTVLGFYLLVAFSPNSGLGLWLKDHLGIQVVFSFPGLVVASIVYSLPFMVQPIHAGLQQLNPALREAAYTMGKSKKTTFLRVLLPVIKPSILTALVMTFAHTIGEFGVVLMIGGNIPNETRVASIAIFESVEMLNYSEAHRYAGVMLSVTFTVLLIVRLVNKKNPRLHTN